MTWGRVRAVAAAGGALLALGACGDDIDLSSTNSKMSYELGYAFWYNDNSQQDPTCGAEEETLTSMSVGNLDSEAFLAGCEDYVDGKDPKVNDPETITQLDDE
jgi:hypothetical protein